MFTRRHGHPDFVTCHCVWRSQTGGDRRLVGTPIGLPGFLAMLVRVDSNNPKSFPYTFGATKGAKVYPKVRK